MADQANFLKSVCVYNSQLIAVEAVLWWTQLGRAIHYYRLMEGLAYDAKSGCAVVDSL